MEGWESFWSGSYMPHGHCYLWQGHILWTNVISDVLIAAAYFSIPFALVLFARRRKDIEFKGLFWLFSAFILLCGITHIVSIVVIWQGYYGLHAVSKALTALASVVTAMYVYRLLPALIQLPTHKQYADAQLRLELERQKRHFAELKQRSQQVFQHATELSPIGLLIINNKQIIRFANPAFANIMECDLADITDKALQTVIPKQTQKRHSHWVKEYFRVPNTEAMNQVVSVPSLSGRPLYLDVSVSRAEYDGEMHVFAAVSDVTEKETIRKTLIEKTRFLETVLNQSINGLYIFDVEQQKNVFINDRYTEITGYSQSDIDEISACDGILTLFHPDDQAALEQHIEQVKSQPDKAVSFKYRFKHKNGHWFWCYSMDVGYQYSELGRVNQFLGTFIDISEVMAFKTQTEFLMRDFKATFEKAAVGLAHVGVDGRWLRVNQTLCNIVGYSEAEMLQKTFQDITYSDDLQDDLAFVDRMLNREIDSYEIDKRYVKKDGSITWVKITVSLVDCVSGHPSYFVVAIECIDRHKKILRETEGLNKSLEQSNQRLQQFAYAASHDLQEPLRKIVAFSDSLSNRVPTLIDDEEVLFELQRLQHSAIKMRRLISDLLHLSRTFNLDINVKYSSLSKIVDSAKDIIQEVIQEHGAVVQLEADIQLEVDDFLFAQVIKNLISNSIKYRREDIPPVIRIFGQTYPEEGNYRIVLEDNGIGFDSNLAAQIFEPFKRLGNKQKVDGSGMGLAICLQIIQAHKGSIFAQATPEKGAIFTIDIPFGENGLC